MKFLLWLPITALLLVMGCKDATDEVTAPAVDLPDGGNAMDIERMEANFAAQFSPPARCVQLRYVSETGVVKTRQKGNSCTCSQGQPVSVTALIWKGVPTNNVIGKASCLVPTLGTVVVAGPATAVDPGGVLGALFGLTSFVGRQVSGTLGCSLSSTVTSSRDPSNRMVICVWH
jgi:hypothetical protein